MNSQVWFDKGTDIVLQFGTKLLGALALWILGRWLIGLAKRLVARAMANRNIDPTVSRYAETALGVLLTFALVVAILGYFGVETTTFAALVAGAGVAIGMAWSGLLAHFAAGIFMVVLRPFKVGDFISAAGVSGTVQEIGLFVTTLNTADNVRTLIGNNKIFSDTIQNFSANSTRRVDLKAQLDHSVDPADAIQRLKARLAQVPNITEPADVAILEFNLAGTVLVVRPRCETKNYWQVYCDTNEAIREVLHAANYPAPKTHHAINRQDD